MNNLHCSIPDIIDLSVLGKQYEETDKYDTNYNPYKIDKLQLYNPLYKTLFGSDIIQEDTSTLSHKSHIIDLKKVSVQDSDSKETPIFIKFSPLLDPYRYMIGKYEIDNDCIRTLPTLNINEESIHPKILSRHNASYVDSFFCYLSNKVLTEYNVPHGLNYYGSYLGVQEKYRVNIADDVEYLRNSKFFNDNIGKHFCIEDADLDLVKNPFSTMNSSRKNKLKINIDTNEIISLDCEELPILDIEPQSNSHDIESVYSKSPSSSRSSSTSSDSSSSDVNYSSDEDENNKKEDNDSNKDEKEDEDEDEEDEDEEDEDEDEDEDEEELFGYIYNFPIQMICMEKCDGTLDELFVNDSMTNENSSSMLMQIVFTILIYQKMFKFTHNDLHTNNIMHIKTKQEFLYYQFDSKVYKVPTFGKIYKIIDFGRGVYNFNGNVFCSDSFAKDGDAVTQYNCEPFFNEKRHILDPNMSFDLCRLGSSLFDFVTDIDDDENELDEVQQTIKRWCEDDNGKNILYKKNGQERYPNFKLYKMIARTVHHHTPEAQLEYDIFKQYIIEKSTDELEELIDIDNLPYMG
jgi:hypothetical protein